MGECRAEGEVSCFDDLLSIFFATRGEVLMISERGGLLSVWAGLKTALVKGVLEGGMSVYVVSSIVDVGIVGGADVFGVAVVSCK
jgi:hypothetical protein